MNLGKYWRNKFDQLALKDMPVWQQASWWYEYIVENQKRFVDNGLRKHSGSKQLLVADIGCGPGINIQQLVKLGHKAVGLDYSINGLMVAKKSAGTDNCQLINGNVSFMPLKEKIFDAVLFFGVLQTADDPERQIKQLSGLLKPNGILLMSTLRQHSIWELPFWPIHILSLQGYYPCISNRNLEVIKSRDLLIPRPTDDKEQQLKRYSTDKIKSWLASAGFHKITFKYDGPLEYFPHLSNSIMTYVRAFKK
ncbi:MAG: methyltransferase domain-containing protein [bacterium]|nr:methyltransferase domain-containing protein [bacterium]